MNDIRTSVLALLASVLPAGLFAGELTVDLWQSAGPQGSGLVQALPGDDIRLEFHAINTGAEPGSGLAVRYAWPEGLEFVDATAMPAAAVWLDTTAGELVWHVGHLAAARAGNATASLAVSARIREAAAGAILGGPLAARADNAQAAFKSGPPAILAVQGMATVDLSAAVTGSFSRAGDSYTVTYDVTIANAGPEASVASVLELEIDPVTLDLIEDGTLSGPAGTQCDVDNLVCVIPALDPGENIVIRATARVLLDSAPTNVPVDFTVITSDTDTDPNNNSAFGNVSLPEPPDSDEGGGAFGLPMLLVLAVGLLAARRRRPDGDCGRAAS